MTTVAFHRKTRRAALGVIPVLVIIALWAIIPAVADIPEYKLPTITDVLATFWDMLISGTLLNAVLASLGRLGLSTLIGAGLAVVVGLIMAQSRTVTSFVEPVAVFFQSVAGIAWLPLTIVWFGLGEASVLFVVANAIFFIVLYNVILGVQSIPAVTINALRVLGANRRQTILEATIPGALVALIAGLRIGVSFGWRSLIGVELIISGSGLGFLGLEAARDFRADVVIVTIFVVGLLWMAMERLILRPIERRTVIRWGVVTEST